MTRMPTDFHGRPIRPGHIIAVAQTYGSHGARLVQRFVREVHPTYLVVQPGPQEPSDKRQIGHILNYQNAIITGGHDAFPEEQPS